MFFWHHCHAYVVSEKVHALKTRWNRPNGINVDFCRNMSLVFKNWLRFYPIFHKGNSFYSIGKKIIILESNKYLYIKTSDVIFSKTIYWCYVLTIKCLPSLSLFNINFPLSQKIENSGNPFRGHVRQCVVKTTL